jgi:hypothetical protein
MKNKLTEEMYLNLLVAKTVTLRSAGYDEVESLEIKEYEFDVIGGECVNLHIWSCSDRSKGHKIIPVPNSIKNIFKKFDLHNL